MKLRNVSWVLLTVGAVGFLGVGYTQVGGTTPLPDHPIITRPISMKNTALFRDASTLWLADNLVSSGVALQGAAKKFVRKTVIERTILVDHFSEWIYRNHHWESAMGWIPVGGNPDLARSLTGTEHLAATILFNRAIISQSPTQLPVADENGIRGVLRPSDTGLSPAQLLALIEQKRQQQVQFLMSGSGGNP